MIIPILANQLAAVSLLAAKTDVRYYLNGVAISQGHLVATDGKALAAVSLNDVPPDYTVIIPLDAIKTFLSMLSPKFRKTGAINLDTEAFELSCGTEIRLPFRPIEGRYPDWQTILPTHASANHHGTFDWSYMATFQRAVGILSNVRTPMVTLVPNGRNAALIKADNEPAFIGVLMPMKDGK